MTTINTIITINEEEYDITIHYHATSYIKADPGRYYGEPGDCWPAEDAEYEFEIDKIEFDPPEGDYLDTYRRIIYKWFDENHSLAVELAEAERKDGEV